MQKRGQYILESERVMTKGTFAKKKNTQNVTVEKQKRDHCFHLYLMQFLYDFYSL